MLRVGCDIGGTFTDFVVLDEASSEIQFEKGLTTPADPSIATLDGLGALDRASPGYAAPADGIMLLQEYLQAAEPVITRVEIIGGEVIYDGRPLPEGLPQSGQGETVSKEDGLAFARQWNAMVLSRPDAEISKAKTRHPGNGTEDTEDNELAW